MGISDEKYPAPYSDLTIAESKDIAEKLDALLEKLPHPVDKSFEPHQLKALNQYLAWLHTRERALLRIWRAALKH